MADIKDDFWDIDKLIPKKKKTMYPFSTKEKLATVTIGGDDAESGNDGALTTLTPPVEISSASYAHTNAFIRSVNITRLTDKYDFYGNFRKAALIYYDYKTPKCDFVSFYSYMPQYSQLNSAQKNFYFYWRDSVRRGKYIKTDYSYFYLYVYEILNLPDKIEKQEGLDKLISLWLAYRADLPSIDPYMASWVQDYCLVYDLACPMEKIGEFIFDVISASDFKEFYLSDISAMGDEGVNAMLAYLSDYDWRRARYAGGSNKEAYKKHMLGAMGLLLRSLESDGSLLSSDHESEHIVRNAFRNSLCTHSVKCRLDIEYIPRSKSEDLRRVVTSSIRYTENKLRALLGVKSRLAITDLENSHKQIIDSYFENIFARVVSERKKAQEPEYERLYDAESRGLSFAGADEIERASWSTTARLVSESDEVIEEVVMALPVAENGEGVSEESACADSYGLSLKDIEFIRAVYELDTDSQAKLADEIGEESATIVERINERFSDSFGDVIIEGDDPDFNVIDDYKEDIEKWLMNIMK